MSMTFEDLVQDPYFINKMTSGDDKKKTDTYQRSVNTNDSYSDSSSDDSYGGYDDEDRDSY